MEEGLILKHTEIVAEAIHGRFENDPEGEIEAWLAIAQQREAMVVELYKGMAIEKRLPVSSPEIEPLVRVVRKAIGGIWAQESAHTMLMKALRTLDDEQLPIVKWLQGSVEGKLTDLATSQGLLAHVAGWIIGFARATGAAPDFTKYLGEVNLEGFFRFSRELENTAVGGYTRILELLTQVEAKGESLKYGGNGRWEFAKTAAEERFHIALFECLLEWLTPEGNHLTPRAAREAAVTIHQLANQYLALRHVEGLKRSPFESLDDDQLISDGGVGDLFGEFGLDFSVSRP